MLIWKPSWLFKFGELQSGRKMQMPKAVFIDVWSIQDGPKANKSLGTNILTQVYLHFEGSWYFCSTHHKIAFFFTTYFCNVPQVILFWWSLVCSHQHVGTVVFWPCVADRGHCHDDWCNLLSFEVSHIDPSGAERTQLHLSLSYELHLNGTISSWNSKIDYSFRQTGCTQELLGLGLSTHLPSVNTNHLS